jgi:putative restriction endonuclease
LGDIRNKAKEGDILIIQRSLDKLDLYRLWLVTQDTPQHRELRQTIGTRKWGLLTADIPVTEDDIEQCQKEEQQAELSQFMLFDNKIRTTETRSRRIARSLVFQTTIQKIYDRCCAICGTGLLRPDGIMEIEAAHIVPKRCQGSDDARNGLALCRRHHWAFDHGLFGITDNREIYIPPKVLRIPANQLLLPFEKKRIIEATNSHLMADGAAFRWHFKEILIS